MLQSSTIELIHQESWISNPKKKQTHNRKALARGIVKWKSYQEHESQEGHWKVPGDVLKVLGAVDLKLMARLLSNVYKTESVSRF